MRRILFTAALALSLGPIACGGAAEKKVDPSAAAPGNQAATQPTPLPHSDRKDDPTVLIPGDSPLTQGMMDRDIDVWEWMLDLRLTEQQRAQWQKLWMDDWKKKDDKGKTEWLTYVHNNGKFWDDMAKRSEAERDLQRLHLLAPDLITLRKAPEALDKWLAALYDEAHKPGGARNPILVAGDPPLTQDMMDLRRLAMDYMLDLHMTDQQRDEYQRLLIKDWKKDPQLWAKNIESWRKPLSSSPYDRRIFHAKERPLLLGGLRKEDAESDRWLLAAYDAAQGDHKPGGERNPILANGDPPLTRDAADQYCDMVEGVLDFSISGGLTADQRQDVQDLLVKTWKSMDNASREDLLQSLQKWPSQERLLVQLRAGHAADQLSQYLLVIHNREQEKYAEAMKLEQQRHEAMMETIRAMPTGGHRWFNPATGEYEYVP